MPDPAKLLATVRRATELFRATPGRSGGIIAVDQADEVLVVGDLHGNIAAFVKILKIAALKEHPGRHLVLQELIHGKERYADGSDKSHQLLDVVAALKCEFPDRLHLIVGNHELSEITGRIISKHGLVLNEIFRQGIDAAYGARGAEVYDAYLTLFGALPLAVRTPNRVFVCHTLPDGRDLDDLDPEILKADTWPPHAMARHGTVYAMTWGRDTAPETADQFASFVDADLFVTGHQPCDEGFRQANHRQIIIDGTDPRPAYCLFPARAPMTIESLLACVKTL